MSVFSGAGQVLVFPGVSPAYADISPGLSYTIAIINNTDADITAGTFTLQDAPALASDWCKPDDALWADVLVEPHCDALPGTVAGPATIVFDAANPLPARSQCQYAIPCVKQFLRVTGAEPPEVVIVVGRLKRTGFANVA